MVHKVSVTLRVEDTCTAHEVLEISDTQKNENRSSGFIVTLHMATIQFTGLHRPSNTGLSSTLFSSSQSRLNDPKEDKYAL